MGFRGLGLPIPSSFGSRTEIGEVSDGIEEEEARSRRRLGFTSPMGGGRRGGRRRPRRGLRGGGDAGEENAASEWGEAQEGPRPRHAAALRRRRPPLGHRRLEEAARVCGATTSRVLGFKPGPFYSSTSCCAPKSAQLA